MFFFFFWLDAWESFFLYSVIFVDIIGYVTCISPGQECFLDGEFATVSILELFDEKFVFVSSLCFSFFPLLEFLSLINVCSPLIWSRSKVGCVLHDYCLEPFRKYTQEKSRLVAVVLQFVEIKMFRGFLLWIFCFCNLFLISYIFFKRLLRGIKSSR